MTSDPENPFRAPEPVSLSDSIEDLENENWLVNRLAKLRKSRRKWTLNCWLAVLFAIAIGAGLLLTAEILKNKPLTYAGAFLIAIGTLIATMGPLSWYWFRPKTR